MISRRRGGAPTPLSQELHWSLHKPPYKFEEEERGKERREEEEEEEGPPGVQSCIRHCQQDFPSGEARPQSHMSVRQPVAE